MLGWMRNLFTPGLPARVLVYIDGAICEKRKVSAQAVVVRDESGLIRLMWSQSGDWCTCNESEYRAAILAFEKFAPHPPLQVTIFSDSQVLVEQMNGRAAVREPRLQVLHFRLKILVQTMHAVAFEHIPRENNRLADALANEALTGGKNGLVFLER